MNPNKLKVWFGAAAAVAGLTMLAAKTGMTRNERQRPTMVILAIVAGIAIIGEYVEYGLERKFLKPTKS